MADHYSLDIDPDGLKSVKEWVGALSNHLHTKGVTVAGTPAEIGEQWTGAAAVSIMGEMTGLGDIMKSPLATDLDAIAGAIGALEGHYRTALEEDLPDLNQRWSDADQTYQDSVDEADSAYDRGTRTEPGEPPMNRAIRDEFQTIRSTAVLSASTARETTRGDIDDDYDELKEFLRQKTRQLNTAMVEHTPVDVPASAIEAYQANGSYPKYPLTSADLLAQLGVTQQYITAQEEAVKEQAEEDVQTLSDLIDTDDFNIDSSADVRELLASYPGLADDPLYAKYFAQEAGPDLVQRLYEVAGYFVGTGETTEADWDAGMTAFNDLVAAGLAGFTDADLAAYVNDFNSPENAPIIGALTGSDHADDRIGALSLALAYNMRYDLSDTSYSNGFDMARHMQDVMTGDLSYEEMVDGFLDGATPGLLARLINNMSEDDRTHWVRELMNSHIYDHRGVRDPEISEAIAALVPQILTSARDAEQGGTLEALFHAIDEYEDNPASDYWSIDISDFLTDPATIDALAELREVMDQAVVAKLFDRYVEEDLMDEILGDLIERDALNDAGMEVTARNIGYLLGLADAADFDLDGGKVLTAALTQVRNTINGELNTLLTEQLPGFARKVPLLQTALAVIDALTAQAEAAEARRQEFADNWADEELHESFAWLIYMQYEGAPESWDAWQADADAQNSVPGGDPLAATSRYLDWLEDHGPGTPEYDLAQQLRDLQSDIGDAHK